jgi:hypothetical protein
MLSEPERTVHRQRYFSEQDFRTAWSHCICQQSSARLLNPFYRASGVTILRKNFLGDCWYERAMSSQIQSQKPGPS